MELTHEHRQIRDALAKWIEAEINPHVDAWEADGIFPARQVFKSLGNMGMLGITKPVAFGGQGLDFSFGAVMAEALGSIKAAGVALSIGVQTDMCTPALAEHGSDELREAFLRPAIAGDMIGCIGVSEPGAGSDVAALKTHARRDGGDYVINGAKLWITNGVQADFCCLLVNTGDGPAHKNKTLIVVPMDTPGVSVTRKIEKIGMRSSDTAQLFFDEVRVPVRNRIGDEGRGFIYQMEQFQVERLWGALNNAATLQRAVDATIAYTRERKAFGKPILDNQYVYFTLAEMQTEIEALKAISWKGVAKIVAGEDASELATMAKLKVGRLCRWIPDGCLQFWGGMGYSEESEISRIFRDVRLTPIGGGADEVMLQVIAKYMGIFPKATST